MEILPGFDLLAHAIDLPALDFGPEIFTERLQPADQLIAGIDVGDFQRPFSERDPRHPFFSRIGPDMFGAVA